MRVKAVLNDVTIIVYYCCSLLCSKAIVMLDIIWKSWTCFCLLLLFLIMSILDNFNGNEPNSFYRYFKEIISTWNFWTLITGLVLSKEQKSFAKIIEFVSVNHTETLCHNYIGYRFNRKISAGTNWFLMSFVPQKWPTMQVQRSIRVHTSAIMAYCQLYYFYNWCNFWTWSQFVHFWANLKTWAISATECLSWLVYWIDLKLISYKSVLSSNFSNILDKSTILDNFFSFFEKPRL